MGSKRQGKAKRGLPEGQEKGRDGWQRILPFIVLAAAVLVYLNTLGHGFVFDDASLILQKPSVIEGKWAEILNTNEYRPVRTFTYALNYAIGGPDPFGYHLFNVLLHGANALLAYLLFLLWSRSKAVAFVGGLIFALHPVQTAAVAYVSGRKDLLATLFLLLACYCYTLFRLKGGRFRLVLAFCFFVVAVLSKEVAAVFPVLVVLIDVVLLRSANGEGRAEQSIARRMVGSVRRRPWAYAVAGLLLLGAAYYAVYVIKASRMVGFWGGSASAHYGTCFKLFVHYLKLAIVPYPLVADYLGRVFDLSPGFLDAPTIVSVAAFIGFIVLAFKLERRHPHIAFGLFWFLAALLPVLQFYPFHELAADHFLYLPLVGGAFAAGHAFQLLAEARGRRTRDVAVLGLVAVFGVMTVDRNRDWKDEFTIWSATYEKAPGSFRANQSLGMHYFVKGDRAKAVEFTKRSTEIDPNKAQAWANLGTYYRFWAVDLRADRRLQDAEAMNTLALQCLGKAIEINPRDLWAFTTMGQTYREFGSIAEERGNPQKAAEYRKQAAKSFQTALEIGSENPSFPLIFYEFSKVYMDAGLYGQALPYLKRVLVAFPNRADVLYDLGTSYFNLRKYQEAIPFLRSAVAQDSSTSRAKIRVGMLAKSYEELGQNQEAIRVYEEALTRFSGLVEIHYNLGVLYHRIGETERGVAHLEKALELAPNGPLAGNIKQMLAIIKADVS